MCTLYFHLPFFCLVVYHYFFLFLTIFYIFMSYIESYDELRKKNPFKYFDLRKKKFLINITYTCSTKVSAIPPMLKCVESSREKLCTIKSYKGHGKVTNWKDQTITYNYHQSSSSSCDFIIEWEAKMPHLLSFVHNKHKQPHDSILYLAWNKKFASGEVREQENDDNYNFSSVPSPRYEKWHNYTCCYVFFFLFLLSMFQKEEKKNLCPRKKNRLKATYQKLTILLFLSSEVVFDFFARIRRKKTKKEFN